MSKMSAFLKMLGLKGSEYDEYDDYYEEFDEEEGKPVKKEKKMPARKRRSKHTHNSVRSSYRDDYEDIDDDIDEDVMKSVEPDRVRRSRKIVPMNSRPGHASEGREVCVFKPETFESCQQICRILMDDKAVVVNYSLMDMGYAQRLIDFVSGACYAMRGNVKQVGDMVVMFTPDDMDITGDIQSAMGYADEYTNRYNDF